MRLFQHRRADAVARPEGHGQQPVAVGEDRGFIQSAAVRESHGLRPCGLVGVRVFADGVPVAGPSVEIAEALIEKKPEAAFRIAPQIAHQRAALWRPRRIRRVDHDAGLRPFRAAIVAGREHEETVRVVTIAHPAGPQPPFRRSLNADDHVADPDTVIVFRPRCGVDHRRLEGQIEQGVILAQTSDGCHEHECHQGAHLEGILMGQARGVPCCFLMPRMTDGPARAPNAAGVRLHSILA